MSEPIITLLILCGIVLAVGAVASAVRLRGHRLPTAPGDRPEVNPALRDAMQHFTSGVIPPWR